MNLNLKFKIIFHTIQAKSLSRGCIIYGICYFKGEIIVLFEIRTKLINYSFVNCSVVNANKRLKCDGLFKLTILVPIHLLIIFFPVTCAENFVFFQQAMGKNSSIKRK